MVDIVFHEVERGPSFATYQGPLCVMRADWRGRVSRFTFVGYIEAGCAQPMIQCWEGILRKEATIVLLNDFWEATGYESGWRVETVEWGKKHPGKLVEAHVLSRSKILNMGIAVAGLAVPSVTLKSHGKRTEFDIVAKQAGLPINPPMPPLPTPKSL